MARFDRSSAAGVAYGSAAPAIEVRGLSFAYPGVKAPVLEGLDWRVSQGAFALLVGGTGSGKSTLLSLLKPEIAPAGERAGELLVLGENVADMDVRASAERVGYVFQDPENQIVCETVWHEMAFGLENLGASRDEMRRRVAETSYFFGLEDWLHRDTDTLSGGRKQLLSLAAVLALRPRVLLLDEPTSQLDPVAEKNFLHALFRVNRELGCTVVVATHQPRPMLEYATCAYRIEDGRVHEAADMASLVCRESLFSDDTLGWGAIRCAKNGVFSRREDNLGSLEPPGDVSSAKKSSELDKSSEFVAQTSLENGLEAFSRTDGSRILQKMHGGSATTLSEGWFRYDRVGGWVLRGLDVTFSAGAVHAVVGGNGCGKSTIVRLIPRFFDVTQGAVRIDGVDVREMSQNKLRSLMGYVPQKGVLFSGTIESNLKYGGENISDADMQQAADIAQATEFIDSKVDRYNSLISQGGTNVSGGQKQRLSISRAIAKHPKIYLFDDSFSALDYKTDLTLRQELSKQTADATVIIVAQRISTILHADNILVLDEGKLVGSGTHEELLASCETYQEIAKSQLSEAELAGVEKGGRA